MTSKRTPKLPAKRWMLLAVILDQPRSGEEYLTEQDIRDLALTNDLIEGMRFSKIKLSPLPGRVKTAQKHLEMPPKLPISGRKPLAYGEKTLDTPPSEAK